MTDTTDICACSVVSFYLLHIRHTVYRIYVGHTTAHNPARIKLGNVENQWVRQVDVWCVQRLNFNYLYACLDLVCICTFVRFLELCHLVYLCMLMLFSAYVLAVCTASLSFIFFHPFDRSFDYPRKSKEQHSKPKHIPSKLMDWPTAPNFPVNFLAPDPPPSCK